MKAMAAIMRVIKAKAQDNTEIPEADVNRATRLHDTLTTTGTEPICMEVVLDPLNNEDTWNRFIRRMNDRRKRMKSATRKETKIFRRNTAREQRTGPRKGYYRHCTTKRNTLYTSAKDHVITTAPAVPKRSSGTFH
jgi:hypothetical protein